MPAFDASSLIKAWDDYPISHFPQLWKWLGEQMEAGNIDMLVVAFEEVEHMAPDCATWAKDAGMNIHAPTDKVFSAGAKIKALLGIVDDDFHPKGVDGNDILIIASAKVYGDDLVSNEAIQRLPPDQVKKRKIPSVCSMAGVGVTCGDFVKFLKDSNVKFG